MGKCRNCGSMTAKDLGPIGVVSPFVMKRVMNLEMGFTSQHPVKRMIRSFASLGNIGKRIFGSAVFVDMEFCTSCTFIQTRVPLPEDGLAKLYADYRSDSYNRERIHYEPEYGLIASQVGSCKQEIDCRINGLNAWLRKKITVGGDFSMLDYGGADGRFLPDFPGLKFVYEISDITPVAGIERVKDEASLGSYSYIQIAHVLEHVPYPLELTLKASSYLGPGGFLYVEVPQDLGDDAIAEIGSGKRRQSVTVHEHINYYTVASATKLMQAAGLDLVEVSAEDVDIGWTVARIIRALGRRRPD